MDQNLIMDMVNANCSMNDLMKFCGRVNYTSSVFKNSFDTYYSLGAILNAINRYENKEISEKYLSFWALSYGIILTASRWNDNEINNETSIKHFIQSEIVETLQSLSCFDESMIYYTRIFKIFDDIYLNINDWQMQPISKNLGAGEYSCFLLINEKNKSFVAFNNLDISNGDAENEKCTTELNNIIVQLKSENFSEINLFENSNKNYVITKADFN